MTTHESPLRYSGRPSMQTNPSSTNLAELLERILDKGIVIAGDISVSLVDIELLTIKIRLLIASVDKAREIGVNWWESDPWLSGRQQQQAEVGKGGGDDRASLESRLERIESTLAQLASSRAGGGSD
ncbi:MAG TPA: gas vesicle protein [Acidimicrobiales bacterium]|nr:gas vesicle protein [Acidimicrobiales bacterium]